MDKNEMDKNERADSLEEAWERAKPLEDVDRKKKSQTSVLSIRIADTLLESLTDLARSEGKTAGTLAREVIESAVEARGRMTPHSLAHLFNRWVGEFFSEAPANFETVWASAPISNGYSWVSREFGIGSLNNYVFTSTEVKGWGIHDPEEATSETESARSKKEVAA